MSILNPHNNPEIGLSVCCNAPTNTIPPSMGDPELIVCSNCNSFCERIWVPMYEKIGKGCFRKIVYEIKSNK